MSMEKKMGVLGIIDKPAFLLPSILIVSAIIFGAVAPDIFNNAASAAFTFVTKYFSWFYALGVSLMIVFCFWAAFGKYGKIKLGGSDAKPTMSFTSWFFVTLISGIAIGTVYWSVGEPISYLTSPPGFTGWEPYSAEAAEGVLKYNFLHWGIHPYAIYTGFGLCFAFIILNGKRRFSMSSGLYPLIGNKTEGIVGKLVNGLCMFSILGCMGTSLGFGVSQFSTGVSYVFGTTISDAAMAVFFIGIVLILAVGTACTGLQKGITPASHVNMYIFIALMVWAFIFGGPLFILNNTTSSIGQYLAFLVPQSFYLEPVKQTGWVANWSIFYWAWWLAAAPSVGLFLTKLAKGRTIREFVLVNMIAPTIFLIAWFGIFGSSAIQMELAGSNIAADIAEWGTPVSLFAYVKNLPLTPVLYGLVFLAIIISITTMINAMIFALSDMSTKPRFLEEGNRRKGPSNVLKIYWGIVMGSIAFILLFSGGLGALQTASVVCGLPIMALELVLAVGFIKAMRQRSKYDLTLTELERNTLRKEESAKEDEKESTATTSAS